MRPDRPIDESCRGAAFIEYIIVTGIVALLGIGAFQQFGGAVAGGLAKEGHSVSGVAASPNAEGSHDAREARGSSGQGGGSGRTATTTPAGDTDLEQGPRASSAEPRNPSATVVLDEPGVDLDADHGSWGGWPLLVLGLGALGAYVLFRRAKTDAPAGAWEGKLREKAGQLQKAWGPKLASVLASVKRMASSEGRS